MLYSREVTFQKSTLGEKTLQYFTIHLSQLSLVTFLLICYKVLTLTFSSIQMNDLLSCLAVNLTRETCFHQSIQKDSLYPKHCSVPFLPEMITMSLSE